MLQKKICMIGAFAVGKTSLTRRFVHSLFSDEYLTTIGVKIERKDIELGDNAVRLMIWDLVGEDDFTQVPITQIRGAAGLVIVVDRTRPGSFDTAKQLHERITAELGEMPHVTLLNKSDLAGESIESVGVDEVQAHFSKAVGCFETSAKTGVCVEEAFTALAMSLAAPAKR